MISLLGHVCPSAERIVSAIQHSALYVGIKIETKGVITDRVRDQKSEVREQKTEDGGETLKGQTVRLLNRGPNLRNPRYPSLSFIGRAFPGVESSHQSSFLSPFLVLVFLPFFFFFFFSGCAVASFVSRLGAGLDVDGVGGREVVNGCGYVYFT